MASNNEALLVEQMKELSRDLNALSLQLKRLELPQDASKTSSHLAIPPKDIQALRPIGYVNWDSTHESLKTEHWKKMSLITEFCGLLERGILLPCGIDLNNINVVDEESRFPKDDVYVNVSNPLIRAEILYIKELPSNKPVIGLVERFLNVAKGDIHTLNSFEKKYGLKWVEPSLVQNRAPTSDTSSIKPVSQDEDPWNLPEDAEIKEVDSERTPTILKHNQSEDELKTQKLTIKFKEFLDELSPFNYKALLIEIVQGLDITTQKEMEVVVDLLFEKVLEEPNSAHVGAILCSKFAKLKVPSDYDPDKFVNFRGLILQKCQIQFETGKSDKQKEIKNDLEDTNDPATSHDDLQMIDEINTTTQLRAIANIKFIGELYKSKMLTIKIIDYCMKNLIDDSNEQKLECLCELLITAGEKLDNERKSSLNDIFEKLKTIVDYKSEKISSHVHSMIQDVIDLRSRKWVIKKVIAFPKTMNQIHDETEKRELLIKLMNEFGMVGKSGDGEDDGVIIRRANDNHNDKTCYTVTALKLQAATQETLNYTKFPPKCFETLQENMYNILEKLQADPNSNREMFTLLDNEASTSHSNIKKTLCLLLYLLNKYRSPI